MTRVTTSEERGKSKEEGKDQESIQSSTLAHL